jgi:hypothetical protein
MRFRFSLRTLLILTALAAAACYGWIARPAILARQFVAAIEQGDFAAADRMISIEADRFLVEWAEKRWAFRTTADVSPLSFALLCSGRRQIRLNVSTFEFDQTVDRLFQFDATPTGIQSRGKTYEGRTTLSIGIQRPIIDRIEPPRREPETQLRR